MMSVTFGLSIIVPTLPGGRKSQPRPSWVTLDIPPVERCQASLHGLPAQQRERIESLDFYEILQRSISRRYLAFKPSG